MELIDELKRLVTKLDEEGIEYALCGGLAMAVYALPRERSRSRRYSTPQEHCR